MSDKKIVKTNISWAKQFKGTNGVTWYNPTEFNGVLFLLREPHKDKGECDYSHIIFKNWKWLANVISKHPSTPYDKACRSRSESIYGNRLYEMLCALPLKEHHLEQIAYANLNIYGGGAAKGNAFCEIIQNPVRLQEEMERIFTCVPKDKTKYIITCKDIFEKLVKPGNVIDNAGFIYSTNQISRIGKMDKIIVVEMIKHPCVSPTIRSSYLVP